MSESDDSLPSVNWVFHKTSQDLHLSNAASTHGAGGVQLRRVNGQWIAMKDLDVNVVRMSLDNLIKTGSGRYLVTRVKRQSKIPKYVRKNSKICHIPRRNHKHDYKPLTINDLESASSANVKHRLTKSRRNLPEVEKSDEASLSSNRQKRKRTNYNIRDISSSDDEDEFPVGTRKFAKRNRMIVSDSDEEYQPPKKDHCLQLGNTKTDVVKPDSSNSPQKRSAQKSSKAETHASVSPIDKNKISDHSSTHGAGESPSKKSNEKTKLNASLKWHSFESYQRYRSKNKLHTVDERDKKKRETIRSKVKDYFKSKQEDKKKASHSYVTPVNMQTIKKGTENCIKLSNIIATVAAKSCKEVHRKQEEIVTTKDISVKPDASQAFTTQASTTEVTVEESNLPLTTLPLHDNVSEEINGNFITDKDVLKSYYLQSARNISSAKSSQTKRNKLPPKFYFPKSEHVEPMDDKAAFKQAYSCSKLIPQGDKVYVKLYGKLITKNFTSLEQKWRYIDKYCAKLFNLKSKISETNYQLSFPHAEEAIRTISENSPENSTSPQSNTANCLQPCSSDSTVENLQQVNSVEKLTNTSTLEKMQNTCTTENLLDHNVKNDPESIRAERTSQGDTSENLTFNRVVEDMLGSISLERQKGTGEDVPQHKVGNLLVQKLPQSHSIDKETHSNVVKLSEGSSLEELPQSSSIVKLPHTYPVETVLESSNVGKPAQSNTVENPTQHSTGGNSSDTTCEKSGSSIIRVNPVKIAVVEKAVQIDNVANTVEQPSIVVEHTVQSYSRDILQNKHVIKEDYNLSNKECTVSHHQSDAEITVAASVASPSADAVESQFPEENLPLSNENLSNKSTVKIENCYSQQETISTCDDDDVEDDLSLMDDYESKYSIIYISDEDDFLSENEEMNSMNVVKLEPLSEDLLKGRTSLDDDISKTTLVTSKHNSNTYNDENFVCDWGSDEDHTADKCKIEQTVSELHFTTTPDIRTTGNSKDLVLRSKDKILEGKTKPHPDTSVGNQNKALYPSDNLFDKKEAKIQETLYQEQDDENDMYDTMTQIDESSPIPDFANVDEDDNGMKNISVAVIESLNSVKQKIGSSDSDGDDSYEILTQPDRDCEIRDLPVIDKGHNVTEKLFDYAIDTVTDIKQKSWVSSSADDEIYDEMTQVDDPPFWGSDSEEGQGNVCTESASCTSPIPKDNIFDSLTQIDPLVIDKNMSSSNDFKEKGNMSNVDQKSDLFTQYHPPESRKTNHSTTKKTVRDYRIGAFDILTQVDTSINESKETNIASQGKTTKICEGRSVSPGVSYIGPLTVDDRQKQDVIDKISHSKKGAREHEYLAETQEDDFFDLQTQLDGKVRQLVQSDHVSDDSEDSLSSDSEDGLFMAATQIDKETFGKTPKQTDRKCMFTEPLPLSYRGKSVDPSKKSTNKDMKHRTASKSAHVKAPTKKISNECFSKSALYKARLEVKQRQYLPKAVSRPRSERLYHNSGDKTSGSALAPTEEEARRLGLPLLDFFGTVKRAVTGQNASVSIVGTRESALVTTEVPCDSATMSTGVTRDKVMNTEVTRDNAIMSTEMTHDNVSISTGMTRKNALMSTEVTRDNTLKSTGANHDNALVSTAASRDNTPVSRGVSCYNFMGSNLESHVKPPPAIKLVVKIPTSGARTALTASTSTQIAGRSETARPCTVARSTPSDGKVHPPYKNTIPHSIMKWNPSWLLEADNHKEPPPVTNNAKVLPLLLKYQTFEDYYKITRSLLLLEVWQSIYEDFKKTLTYEMMNVVCKKQISTSKALWCGLITEDMYRKRKVPKEGDVIILHTKMKKENKRIMGYVDKQTEKLTPAEAKFSLTQFPLLKDDPISKQPDVHMMDIIITHRQDITHMPNPPTFSFIQVIGNIGTFMRQFNSLIALQPPAGGDSPMPIILNPCSNLDSFRDTNFISDHHGKKTNLNESQQRAVLTATRLMQHPSSKPRFALIQGPPGTGKTCVIRRIVGNLLKNKTFNILICAHSNSAVDEVMRRFHQDPEFSHKRHMLRLGQFHVMARDVRDYSMDRTLERVYDKMKQHSASSLCGNGSVMQEYDALCKRSHSLESALAAAKMAKDSSKELSVKAELYKVKQQLSCLNSSTLNLTPQKKQAIRRDIMTKARIVCCTLSFTGSLSFGFENIYTNKLKQFFNCVIIDEATQCTELDCLIPLKNGINKVVLVGDPEQLPATVRSQKAMQYNYGQSLFERFANNFKCLSASDNPTVFLNMQYRMHRDICAFPSKHIYLDRLRCFSETQRESDMNHAYRVFDLQYTRETNDNQGGIYNAQEAEFIVELLEMLRSQGKYKKSDIGVISPYTLHNRQIEHYIDARFHDHTHQEMIEVNTVDGFQGREKNIIVFSCVRAASNTVGFMYDRRRINVALTRARSCLYIIGNLATLKLDENWRALIDDARTRDAIITVRSTSDHHAAISKCFKGKPASFT